MLPMIGSRRSTSIAIPISVLITANASVPASMHARAFAAMSVWFGDSFVINGFFVTFRHAATTRADMSG